MLDKSIFNTEQVFSSLGQAVHLAKKKGRNRVQIYQIDGPWLIQHATEMEATLALKENGLCSIDKKLNIYKYKNLNITKN